LAEKFHLAERKARAGFKVASDRSRFLLLAPKIRDNGTQVGPIRSGIEAQWNPNTITLNAKNEVFFEVLAQRKCCKPKFYLICQLFLTFIRCLKAIISLKSLKNFTLEMFQMCFNNFCSPTIKYI